MSASVLRADAAGAAVTCVGATGEGASGAAEPATVCALGVFDGVHRGHRTIIGAAADDARQLGALCDVVTFDPDPDDVLFGVRPLSRLLETPDRVELLRQAGADVVSCLGFDHELAGMVWQDFVREQLCRRRRLLRVHVGTNFRFGRGGQGTPELLAQMGRELGFSVVTHDLLQEEGEVVSSTRIRGLLRAGRVEAAARLLGRCHVVRGRVQHGRGEGTGMGFPTANVACDGRDCMPGEGVYGGWVVVGDAAWPAAINVGAPVSFDARERPSFLEANLMGFEGDLYGRDVAVVFAAWLRGARRFESVEELERVVGGNIAWVREYLGEGRVALDDVSARAGAAAGAGADADAAAGAGLWAFQPPATHVNPAES